MRNQDAGYALALELQQQFQQGIAVFFVQTGGGLVQDQQLHFLGKCLGNFDQLLFAHAQVRDQRVGRFVESHFLQQCFGFDVGRIPVNHTARGLLIAQENVLGDGEQWHQCQLLVDDDDAQGFTVVNALEFAFFALVADFTFVLAMRVYATEYLHQGGFACAIFSNDGMNLARQHCEVHIAERRHAMECFAHPTHF